MPEFSTESLNQLKTCHIDLQTLFMEVIKHLDCKIIEGHRGQEGQEAAFKAGNTQLHYPNGKHNATPSNAVDVLPYPVNWTDTKTHIYFAGYVIALAELLKSQGKIKHTIRWGGDWDMNKTEIGKGFQDFAHYELVL